MEVPEFFIGGFFGAGAGDFSPEKKQSDQKPGDHFPVDDLLDFSNEDGMIIDGFFDNAAGNTTDSSAVTAVDSCNSSVSGGEPQFFCNRSFGDCQFAGELCVPYDDLAELEWLSNFVEDSFSTEKDLQALQFVSSSKAITNISTKPHTPKTSSSSETLPNETARNAAFFHPETPLPGKARSKRSRAAPGDWSTRLVELITPNNENKPVKTTSSVKREGSISNRNSGNSGRKCLHCATDKTPQWRTGPMGPKTLCNACGVRYKSGRLVPEYRPAASPTYVSTKHSNSHRKVLELRRQKDDVQHLLSQSSIFGVSNDGHDFLIHHHTGPDFRHMI